MIAAVFLLLGCGALVQWRRSYTHFDSLRWRGLVVMTAEGKLCLLHSDAAPDGPSRTGLHTVPYNPADKGSTIIRWPNWSFSRSTDLVRGEKKLTIVSPLWFVAAVCALPPLWWMTRGRQAARIADEMD